MKVQHQQIMIEIKKIKKVDVPGLLHDREFWTQSFLAISKHRLSAHYKNPHLQDDDIVLLLAYLNNELVGYMGLFVDKVNIGQRQMKIGWLSTWWVHPKTKGTGIGRAILNTMYEANDGFIGISQFTPSAKRVYDSSGYFTTLKNNHGLKAVLRSNLTFVLPALFPKLKKMSGLFNAVDRLANVFINLRLELQRKMMASRLKKNLVIEYQSAIDSEVRELIDRTGKNDLSDKSDEFFEWLKAYNWVQAAPLLDFTKKERYEFSIYDKDFGFSYLKIIQDGKCVGFLVLQRRNYVLKVLFTYFDAVDGHDALISDVIKLHAISQDVREIICYDERICAEFKKSYVFLYTTKKVKHSIISKAFGTSGFESTRMNFGDGDCSFA
ncbi:GNAT family N-acetyltransferase [Flavobacterium selenitireducens]|uniref:GNAT family N-acetyltransferase n=1 Tax=Flavobacterium selenitireducens TaxID=2722704 RepID=UPI00168ADBD9|nr:GNAT family N-acetyltransferase [Flavobacterium selenitireducens]MBD3581812.1 GNAT family N-acetyltransferase [Flavobacterium selenitireducens]